LLLVAPGEFQELGTYKAWLDQGRL
jgi:hypothetical protein